MSVDREFIERAVRTASPNALRIALYHQTRNPRLAEMQAGPVPVQGGALTAIRLDRIHNDELYEMAVDYLVDAPAPKPSPTKDETVELLTLFTGSEPTEQELHYCYEDLAFDEFPRDVTWSDGPPAAAVEDFHVTIVGAGFSGIAIGIQLDRLGIAYRIIEKNPGIGGTWFINDYPQARVDVPSRMYQYRFIKNHPWKSYFATGEELKEYLAMVVRDFDLEHRIDLEHELSAATWNDDTKKWELVIDGPNGKEETETNVVISCVGLFNRPNLPDIEGIDDFEGAMFHTTAWDHDYDYTGERVALIGTGSTGTQLMPEVAERAGHLEVFQRTPSWVNPVKGYKATVPEEEQWLLDNMPDYWNWAVLTGSLDELQLQTLQNMDWDWVEQGGRVNERNDIYAARLKDFIRSKVGDDDELYNKLVPGYAPLARRLVIDNGFYDALQQDNVDLVTDPIDHINASGIVTKSPSTGEMVERPFDMIVLGAGFKTADYMWPVEYRGRGGTTLEDLWKRDGARAYLGLTMPTFPNFFTIYGPNGQARGGSFHSWATSFARYIGGLLVHTLESGNRSFEVREDVFDAYNERMDREHHDILWEHEGGGSYYVNEHGRSGVNMPFTQQDYYEWIRQADIENYEIV